MYYLYHLFISWKDKIIHNNQEYIFIKMFYSYLHDLNILIKVIKLYLKCLSIIFNHIQYF